MPLVNGSPYQYANIELSVYDEEGGGELLGVIRGTTEISYSDTVEREKLRSNDQVCIDATDGDYDAEGSWTVYRYTLDEYHEMCRRAGKAPYKMRMTMVVNYGFRDKPVKTDVITDVRLAGREQGHSSGPAGLTATLSMFIGGVIYINGVHPLDPAQNLS